MNFKTNFANYVCITNPTKNELVFISIQWSYAFNIDLALVILPHISTQKSQNLKNRHYLSICENIF